MKKEGSEIKTLKQKITVIYIVLVFITATVGTISAFSLNNLTKGIDGLMIDNYKSIGVVTEMLQCVDNQNNEILKYMMSSKKSIIDEFYKNNDEFYRLLNIERNNITEPGEKELAQKVGEEYLNFLKSFSEFLEMQSKQDSSAKVSFYNSTITPNIEAIKNDLKNISKLNEKAMFEGKNRVKITSNRYSYVIFFISIFAVIAGLLISIFFTNRYLRPIYLLAEAIKSVKEGDLIKQAPIIYEDEIGMLAQEFNNMSKRLYEFEQSTKGKLLMERNKSLTIVKSISDPLIVLDTNYKIILLNTSCELFFDVLEEYAINKHLLEIIRNPELYDHISMVIQNKESKNEKIISMNNGNKVYFFNTVVTTVKDKDANINGVVVLLQDITKLKQLEKIKADFIATISHEFKTPLTSIMIGASLMKENNIGLLNDKQKDIMEAIEEDGQNLTDLVNNLLQLTKIESGKALFDFKACSIKDIILNCLDFFSEQATMRKIKLDTELQEDLPGVFCDEEKIIWVLNNLISNALKYTNENGNITIRALLDNDKIYISVKDTGIGIPTEFHEKIFEKFVQISNVNRESNGTGLGLAIAKEIVQIHGGKIWCESKVNKGSKFTFMLPIVARNIKI